MRRSILAIGAAAALALSGLAVPAQAADQAQLSVLHGVPGLTVDVYVNGERTLNNFKPGTLAGPLKLDAGTYTVAITAADAEDDSDPAIGEWNPYRALEHYPGTFAELEVLAENCERTLPGIAGWSEQ